MFIGREKELVLLQQDYIGKAVMVYGKRRVGKTTLIQKALDNCPYQTVYFECLKGTVQENIDSLVDELVRAKILPVALSFSTLQDVFTYLNTLPQKMVVVIDEYPYLKVMNEPTTVDSVFQSIIDNRLGNIELILSGSHIGMMKDLLQEKNALYGRFAVTIKLNELNYLDTAKFYPDKTPTTRWRTMLYSAVLLCESGVASYCHAARKHRQYNSKSCECGVPVCQSVAVVGLFRQNQRRAYLCSHW